MEQYSLFDILPDGDPTKELFREKEATVWKWSFKDYPPSNGLKVFSLFACGGGSTMGYKLAGCEVLGCCEIDPRMNEVYVKNHHPKYNYLMDIRDFNKLDNLPKELYNLDILDGSPPCSTFSMAGQREDSWGVEKKFKEGQKLQTLDDLPFVMIETVAKLRPKVVIMENVEGLLMGAAWEYVNKIYKQFNAIGYQVRHQLLKGENMGIPQLRHRVFFIATRLDFDLRRIDLSFNYEVVKYGTIKTGKGQRVDPKSKTYQMLKEIKPGETSLEGAFRRIYGTSAMFSSKVVDDDSILLTIRGKINDYFRRETGERISVEDVINSQTFPQDFDFIARSSNKVGYICGMSVPPVMIKRVVTRFIESKIFESKEIENG